MRKRISLLLLMLLTSAQALLAWDGSGTSSSPYLIRSASDWNQLASDVTAGNSGGGQDTGRQVPPGVRVTPVTR